MTQQILLLNSQFSSHGDYDGLSQNDYVTISDGFEDLHRTNKIVTSTSTTISVKTFHNLLTHDDLYTVTKPSEADFHIYQYNSTKIGTVREQTQSMQIIQRDFISHTIQ